VGTHHPNVSSGLAFALAGGSALAMRLGRAGSGAALLGVAAAFVVVVASGSRGGLAALAVAGVALALVLAGRVLGARRVGVRVAVVATAGLLLLGGTQWMFMNASLVAPQWSAAWSETAAAIGVSAEARELPLVARLDRLKEPLSTSGGRVGTWLLVREMIAARPVLGYGFDAVTRVFALGAESELTNPLVHPHSGYLVAALQGGALLLVAALAAVGSLVLRVVRRAVTGDAVASLVLATAAGIAVLEQLDSVIGYGFVAAPVVLALIGATITNDARATSATGGPSVTDASVISA
jgi:O-antigen ligase